MAGFQIAGDVALTPGGTDLALATNVAEFKQRVRAGLGIFLGQWRYDRNKGVDWIGRVFGQRDTELPENEIRKYLRSFPEVATIDRLELRIDRQSRALLVQFEVTAEPYGSVELAVAVPVLVF